MALRSALSLVLAALMALASQAMAVGRSHAAAGAYALELCAEDGAAAVVFDVRGRPVDPVHLCPDCVAGLALALPPPAVQPARPFAAVQAVAAAVALPVPAPHAPAPPARGPPSLA